MQSISLCRDVTMPFAAVVAFLASSLICASPVLGDEPRIGINRVNLAWLSPSARRQVLGNMTASGVRLVRLSLTPPIEESIDAVRVAHEHGMKILLEIPLSKESFYRAGVERRPGLGRVWDMYRLSDIDLRKFRTTFSTALKRIDELGIALAAIEPGNEINWGGYNGDLSVFSNSNVRTARSLSELNNRQEFESGVDEYVMITKIVREEIAATANNQKAKVVSAGLSDIPAEFADKRGVERLDPAEFIEILRARGIEEHIDAYGVHLYLNRSASRNARRRHIESAVSFCAAPGRGKPCWITEWGVANSSNACPLDDAERERIVHEVRGLFEKLMLAGHISTAFYFDWDSKTPYSVWRCDTLTPAGRAALAPFPPAAVTHDH